MSISPKIALHQLTFIYWEWGDVILIFCFLPRFLQNTTEIDIGIKAVSLFAPFKVKKCSTSPCGWVSRQSGGGGGGQREAGNNHITKIIILRKKLLMVLKLTVYVYRTHASNSLLVDFFHIKFNFAWFFSDNQHRQNRQLWRNCDVIHGMFVLLLAYME